jgi:hypothetical protein|nr:MAG TPA: hypothetical protein [Caudoviricetes sp.]
MGTKKEIKIKGGKVIKYKKAIKDRLYLGLNNKICKNPRYWCRLHEIYLSEDDVILKHCKCKQTFDMLGSYRCGNLEVL